LRLHFEYLDQYVTCGRVKPFLAALAMPSLQIKIPTPITVHLDHCAQCAQDLQTLKNLSLETGQLARLSRLLGESPDADLACCRRAEPSIADLASGSLDAIETDVLEHVCVCPRCRTRVHECRQSLLTGQQTGSAPLGSHRGHNAPAAEIFDCVVPYGMEEPRRGFEMPIDKACLESMQALHETLYNIAERADSGTATVYATTEEDNQVAAGAHDRYAAHGVNVRVIQRAPEPATEGRAAQQRGGVRAAVKPLVKIAAAAAVIPLVLVLLVHTRSASGTGPEEIVDAFTTASNVHVQRLHPDREEIVWELWASREPDLLMTTANNACTLYDMDSRRKWQKNLATGTVETFPLDESECQGARSIMEGSLGLPLHGVPPDRQWEPLPHDDINDVDVYALSWTPGASNGRAYLARWVVEVDSRKKRPTRTRLYHKYSSEDGWELQSQQLLKYPTEYDIRAAVTERFPPGAALPI
jgi:hypothetical protein